MAQRSAQALNRMSSIGDPGDSAHALAHLERRIEAAAIDLFLPEEQRLTDHQRAQMRRLYRNLIRSIEDEMRARLIVRLDRPEEDVPAELLAALGATHVEIAIPLLEDMGSGSEGRLVELLLRRADAQRLASAIGAETLRPASLVQQLLDLGHADIAEATMEMMVADSRARDSFGDPQIEGTDLPDDVRRWLSWRIAAALRTYMVRRHGIPAEVADRHMSAIAAEQIALHDPPLSLERAAARLTRLLADHGILDDELLLAALDDGLLALFTAILSHRGRIDEASVWAMIVDPVQWMAATLLRAIGCAREVAVTALWRLGTAHGSTEEKIVERVERFDALPVDWAEGALDIWRSEREYRIAVTEFAMRDAAT
jgi:hypothetical protein